MRQEHPDIDKIISHIFHPVDFYGLFGGHCLSAYKGSANSGGVMATIYEGRNDEGPPIKVLHLSAGGFYLACNYIYSASPERFDQNVDMVMDFLKDLGVIFLGPPLKR